MTAGASSRSLRRFVTGPVEARDGAGPLARFVQPRRRAPNTCELCGTGIGGDHRHLVDLDRRALACSCRACALLLEAPGAARRRYLVVGERYGAVRPFTLTPLQWNALQIPVGLAFFLRTSTPETRTVAFYPSPAGATESELVLDAWEEVMAANPSLAGVAADTEAVLVRLRPAGPAGALDPPGPECYVVPVDRCYELVGRLRASWHGFDGGPEAAGHIDAFFADVRARSGAGGGAREPATGEREAAG